MQRKRSDSSTYELDTIKQHQAFLSRCVDCGETWKPASLCVCVFHIARPWWLGALLVVYTPASCATTQPHAGRAAAPCWTEAPWGSLTLKCLTFSCLVLPWAWFWHWERQWFPCLTVSWLILRKAWDNLTAIPSVSINCFIRRRPFLPLISSSIWSFASRPAAACLSAGLQPVPSSRSLSLPPGASFGEEISPPASLQRAPLPAFSPRRRKLCPAGWVLGNNDVQI